METELQDRDEDGNWVLEAIDAVIDGKEKNNSIQAKYLTLHLDSQDTRITDPYAEAGMKDCAIIKLLKDNKKEYEELVTEIKSGLRMQKKYLNL
ncbi:hypothetical protein LOZ80_34630 [Paenibacillus sp. HWE-109]|uniref:hypothetical protein n=1 Tax=Paenibacillus sp. HWE-109 TaxID=1306526 RepID=UPI001EDF1864|nr:hypothetical protein [Paenibacillus sp. HWE-109]UKS26595.1 hypothetical protein LOZ80_34630 [Paenibacillus sp. HWE-109]